MTIGDLQNKIKEAKETYGITDGTEIVFLGLPGGGVCILAKSGVAYYEIAAEVNKEN